jgi:hypothetical protein
MSNENPARWVPDPMGRHEYRYWDGSQWTDHVADNGVTGLDAPIPTPDVVVDDVAPAAAASGATAAWAGYRRLPTWAQVVIPLAVAFVAIGVIGNITKSDDSGANAARSVEARGSSETRLRAAPSTTTASTTSTTITTTTVPPTTLPPTTVPPPTEPPTLPPPPPTAAPFVPPAPQSGGCDTNYSGCVPIASDVDCAGGGGNGPAYVAGPVQVIGTDIYGLDSDHDGIGCESD